MYAQTRPRFILSSEGVFGGMEFEPMLAPREKSPVPKMSPEEDRTRDAVDSEPKHYQLSYSGPLVCNNSRIPDQNGIYLNYITCLRYMPFWSATLELFAITASKYCNTRRSPTHPSVSNS